MSSPQFEKEQRELPRLADRLGFANVVIDQQRREVSRLRIQHGKDAAYIQELEQTIQDRDQEILEMKREPLKGVKLKKLADEQLRRVYTEQIKRLKAMVRASRQARDRAIAMVHKTNP